MKTSCSGRLGVIATSLLLLFGSGCASEAGTSQDDAPAETTSDELTARTVARNVEIREAASLAPGRYSIVMTGTGDADLYVRAGSAPTTTAFDCRPFRSGSNETCDVTLTATSTLHIMVRGFAASSTFTVERRAAPPEAVLLPSKDEILRAHRTLQRTPSFNSDLFGDGEFTPWPSMLSSMTPVADITTAKGWQVHQEFVRVTQGVFATERDEALGNWKQFKDDRVEGQSPYRLWRQGATGRLVFAGATTASPLGASDGHFLTGAEPLQPFQMLQFFDAADLGNFFDSCVPFKKTGVEYLICRQLTHAPRAIQKIRYEIWRRTS